ncbi:MAG: MOSC domain-containing protein [Acidimicrobiales bacterium]
MTDAPTSRSTAADFPIDASQYTDMDRAGTLRALGVWWALTLDGLDPALVASMLEEQVAVLGAAGARAGSGTAEPLDAVEAMSSNLDVRSLGRGRADQVLVASLTLLRRAGRALAATGAFASSSGSVHGLFRSGGGVPKLPEDVVEIGARGVAGDRQQARRHHGRPWQAQCLWSKETVDRLRAEGHPIDPGQAGENISISGLDWTLIRPGTRLRLGRAVLAETSLPAIPCSKNAQWFRDGDFNRMHHERESAISRMYATVLRGGPVRTGDEVTLEP